MEVKKIVEGMTAPQVAQVIDENFNAINNEKATVEAVADVQKNVNRSDDNTGVLYYPEYSSTEPVAVGDVRRYEGLLYRAKEAGAYDWDPEKWERVTLKQLEDEKLSELGSEVITIEQSFKKVKNYIEGKIISTSGEETVSVGGSCTDYIQVESSTEYYAYMGGKSDNGAIAYYDKDKNFISWTSLTISERTLNIPSNVVFVRLTLFTENASEAYVRKGNKYIWRAYKYTMDSEFEELAESIVKESNFTEGKVVNSSGNLVDSTEGAATDFISVNPNTEYKAYTGGKVTGGAIAYYDKDKNFINWTSLTISERIITTKEDAWYVRMAVNMSNVDKTYLKKGDEVVWEPYSTIIKGMVSKKEFDELKTQIELSNGDSNENGSSNIKLDILYYDSMYRTIDFGRTYVGKNTIVSNGALNQYSSANVLSMAVGESVKFLKGEILKTDWANYKISLIKITGDEYIFIGWIYDDYIFDNDGEYMLCFATRPEVAMTESIAEEILNNVYIYTNQGYTHEAFAQNEIKYNKVNGYMSGGKLQSQTELKEVSTGFIRGYKGSRINIAYKAINRTIRPWIRISEYTNDGVFVKDSTYIIESDESFNLYEYNDNGLVRISWRGVDDPLVSVSYIAKECIKNHEFASLFARKCGRKVLHTGSKLAPNNSIPAFRIAGERGVFGIELDPNLTKDGEIVMSHEPTIKGAYNYYGDLTIADMTLSELRQYRRITDGSYTDEELVIPTIEDTLQICRQYDMLCILDVKVFSNISVFCNKMMDSIYRYNMQNAVIVLCWSNNLLKYVKNKYPSIAISTYGHISDFDNNTENVVISTEYTDSIKESIKEWHNKGYMVNLFTASSVEDEKKMKEALADMITTDITPEG